MFDEPDEVDDGSALAAVYPEIGVHYWITPHVRLTGNGAYYVTTEGRSRDFWYYGLNVGFLRK